MEYTCIKPASRVKGEAVFLGDKSIAHRAIILSAIARGNTRIKNFPANDDCLSTIDAFKKLGVRIIYKADKKRSGVAGILVYGRGLHGLKKPRKPIFIEESGTTFRLLLGLLAGQDFSVKLIAGKSLSKRPMKRVIEPLRLMCADINGRRLALGTRRDEYPPIVISESKLKGISYEMPVASAQVKSAILLAGLYVSGATRIIEDIKTRDHTERMLKLFGAEVSSNNNRLIIKGNKELVSPRVIEIPGDISSASFFMVLASIIPGSEILLKNVSLNSERIGIIGALKKMGGNIKVVRRKGNVLFSEPSGDILVKSNILKGIAVRKEEIASLIDELPVLMVAACFAKGKTVFSGIAELRVKETDRIKSMADNLAKMRADIRVISSEKIIINGGKQLSHARVKSFGDHRTAMSLIIAGLSASGVEIDDVACINKSFPNFFDILKKIVR